MIEPDTEIGPSDQTQPCDQTMIEPCIKTEPYDPDEMNRVHDEDSNAEGGKVAIVPEVSSSGEMDTFERVKMEPEEITGMSEDGEISIEEKFESESVISETDLSIKYELGTCESASPKNNDQTSMITDSVVKKEEEEEYLGSLGLKPGQLPIHVIDPIHGGGIVMVQEIDRSVSMGRRSRKGAVL
jgi:hypothetical protein